MINKKYIIGIVIISLFIITINYSTIKNIPNIITKKSNILYSRSSDIINTGNLISYMEEIKNENYINDCIDKISYYNVTKYNECIQLIISKKCSDEPINKTCINLSNSYSYSCNPYQVTLNKTDCIKTGEINVSGKMIAYQDYFCGLNKLKVVCDSKFDGNGDGICQSGESCILFNDVNKTIVPTEIKNSYGKTIFTK